MSGVSNKKEPEVMKNHLQYKFKVGYQSASHMIHDIILNADWSYHMVHMNVTEIGKQAKNTVTHGVHKNGTMQVNLY